MAMYSTLQQGRLLLKNISSFSADSILTLHLQVQLVNWKEMANYGHIMSTVRWFDIKSLLTVMLISSELFLLGEFLVGFLLIVRWNLQPGIFLVTHVQYPKPKTYLPKNHRHFVSITISDSVTKSLLFRSIYLQPVIQAQCYGYHNVFR